MKPACQPCWLQSLCLWPSTVLCLPDVWNVYRMFLWYKFQCMCVCFFLDSWISQSASFPRNQKQPGVDSLSPVASLPKQIFQPSAQQQPTKPVKVTCANCKKPLQKGQTAYQRKGSAHLFCSTTCLSSFSHKPAPKKLCVMCKK